MFRTGFQSSAKTNIIKFINTLEVYIKDAPICHCISIEMALR